MRKVNEIFGDYEAIGCMNSAVVESAILNKKTKTFNMKLSSDKYIEIKAIEALNSFIKKRFVVDDSVITVSYADGTPKKPVEQEMGDIVLSLEDRYPAIKALLSNSDYEVKGSSISFSFKMAVSSFLKSMGYDKKVHEVIKELYDSSYKINFVDAITNEELKKQREQIQEKEKQLIEKEMKATYSFEAPKMAPPPENKKPEGKGEEEGKKEGKKADPVLILGRSSKIKEPMIKITDISPDEGKVSIQGEISNID
jgi:DNA polymerase-3 subunit alpha (Gram-positive type)